MIHRDRRDPALDGEEMRPLFTRAQRATPNVAVPKPDAHPTAPDGPADSPVDAVLAAQQHLTETRTRWTAALKATNSGRTADMAELALAQAEYDEARAALQRREEEATEHLRRLKEMRARRQAAEARARMIAAQSEGWREAAELAAAPKRRRLLGRLLRR